MPTEPRIEQAQASAEQAGRAAPTHSPAGLSLGSPDGLGGGGAFVGPYRLERALGRGGMGLVFLAHRADQQYEKRVAIKLLSGTSREYALERFRSERQILAKLDHPHIARMLDGGVTADGEPYFVMDYVPGGEAIDEYCDHHKLSIRSRIELFLTVCDAVHYAHRFLVVHRDLKPSNVQVSREGVAKLVDFGIAKDLLAAIDDDPRGPAAPHQTGTIAGVAMTPGYASPEQVRGESIGTASDIYALGVLLYELMTGTTPYVAGASDIDGLLREVTEGVLAPPSECYARRRRSVPEPVLAARGLTKPKQLERMLAGDLDSIILRAMARQAQDRYASADQLAEDLRRYLDGELVVATQHNTAYRLKKFLERYKAISSTVSIAILLSLATAGTMASLALKAHWELADAQKQNAQARQVTAFLSGIHRRAPAGAPSEDVLAMAAKQLGSYRRGEAPWKEPARVAVAESMVGARLDSEASMMLEQMVTDNQKAFNQANPERVREMALLAEARMNAGDAREAAAWFRRALDARRELNEVPPEVPAEKDLEAKLADALSRIRR